MCLIVKSIFVFRVCQEIDSLLKSSTKHVHLWDVIKIRFEYLFALCDWIGLVFDFNLGIILHKKQLKGVFYT